MALERELAELREGPDQQLVVIPSWVRQLLSNPAGLLSDDTAVVRQHFRPAVFRWHGRGTRGTLAAPTADVARVG